MKKRAIVIGSACLVILVAIGGIVYATNRTSKNAPHFWRAAKATKASQACLPANPHVTLAKATRDGIEMRAVGYLSDVPAGTNVDVRIASYTGTAVTGSDHYAGTYGTYNFAMAKQADGWHFTSFKHCD